MCARNWLKVGSGFSDLRSAEKSFGPFQVLILLLQRERLCIRSGRLAEKALRGACKSGQLGSGSLFAGLEEPTNGSPRKAERLLSPPRAARRARSSAASAPGLLDFVVTTTEEGKHHTPSLHRRAVARYPDLLIGGRSQDVGMRPVVRGAWLTAALLVVASCIRTPRGEPTEQPVIVDSPRPAGRRDAELPPAALRRAGGLGPELPVAPLLRRRVCPTVSRRRIGRARSEFLCEAGKPQFETMVSLPFGLNRVSLLDSQRILSDQRNHYGLRA